MRTAAGFNQFYAVTDPWQISHPRLRDKVLRRAVAKFVPGKSVLELGCGEGHLTQAILNSAWRPRVHPYLQKRPDISASHPIPSTASQPQ